MSLNRLLPFVVAVLIGCSPDVPTITSFKDEWRLVTVERNSLVALNMPAGSESNSNVWSGPNGIAFPVGATRSFRGDVFLLHDTEPWIVIMDAATLTARDTIDLGAQGVPHDIAFANATTAYVSLPRVIGIGVVDLTTNTLVRTIDVGASPTGIAATGNQICAVLPSTNEAVIIDSRTNNVEARVGTGRAPMFVEADQLNNLFCIVCLGSGKIDADASSVPLLEFLSATTRQIIKSMDVSGRATNATTQVPRGLVVTGSEFAFVPVQNGLVRVNTRQRNRTIVMQQESYDGIAYNPARAEILVTRSREGASTCEILDEFGEVIRSSVTRPDSIRTVFAVGP